MKHKFLIVLLAVVTTLCMVFGFAGCSLSDLFGGKESGKTDPPVVDPSSDDKEQSGEQKPDGEQGGSGQTEKPKPSLPEEGYSENGLRFDLNSDGQSYAVSEGNFNGSTLIIPDTFNGAPVTSIKYGGFGDCSGLTLITIPDSVTEIGGMAFNNTSYYNNDSNWTSEVLYIGNHLIEAKDTISGSYSIRGGTKTIADYAFWKSSGLTSITIPYCVTSIGDCAFV